MIVHSPSWQPETETQVIENLRRRYENDGFTFTAEPSAAQLPDFLGSYRPDALAQKPGRNVVIEVKQRQTPSAERALTDIRRLFDGHADWQLQVVVTGTDPLQALKIPIAAPATVRGGIAEVRALAAQGHRAAAFITAWSVLEAAFRAVDGEPSRPRTPGTVVQTLAMNGTIDPDTERQVRGLIDLRNRIVHGDLSAEPAPSEIDLVLSAIEQTLGAEAA